MTGKLVRDLIPDIIRATGATPITRTASPAEYADALRAKLTEEAGEYLDGGDPAELADILEAVLALAALDGITPETLERMRAAKARDRGAFTRRVIWLGNAAAAEG
jgi:predicted house-cleaning noncanonical NTP pyrophosphatase (MazG superfamily)